MFPVSNQIQSAAEVENCIPTSIVMDVLVVAVDEPMSDRIMTHSEVDQQKR